MITPEEIFGITEEAVNKINDFIGKLLSIEGKVFFTVSVQTNYKDEPYLKIISNELKDYTGIMKYQSWTKSLN